MVPAWVWVLGRGLAWGLAVESASVWASLSAPGLVLVLLLAWGLASHQGSGLESGQASASALPLAPGSGLARRSGAA